MFARPTTFIDSDVMSKMAENNPLLAMMTDSETIKKNTDAWMKAMPGSSEAAVNDFAANSVAAMAASSAVGLSMYSQMVGTMFGAMTSAMEAAEQQKGDMPLFNPLTFDWTSGSFEEEGEKPATPKAPTPIQPKMAETKIIKEVSPQNSAVKPTKIEKPTVPDDLKLISGVGPKLESVLNGLGVWTFEQIAAWTPAEIVWVDDFLQFSGRIERDDWLKQAAELAKS